MDASLIGAFRWVAGAALACAIAGCVGQVGDAGGPAAGAAPGAGHRGASGAPVAGVNIEGATGIVLLEVDHATGELRRKIVYPGFDYVRLVRQTRRGTFLMAASHVVFEGDQQGNVLWKTAIRAWHAWKVLALPDGTTVASSGGEATLVVLDADHKVKLTIGGKPAAGTVVAPGVTSGQISPRFFADFRVLPGGNYLVMNARIHADDSATSIQVLEYDPAGKLVWHWKQTPPSRFRQLEAVIPLDGLDPGLLYDESNGVMEPVRLP